MPLGRTAPRSVRRRSRRWGCDQRRGSPGSRTAGKRSKPQGTRRWTAFGHCVSDHYGLGFQISSLLSHASTSIILGGILGGFIFGFYWVTTTAVFGMHMDAFSALGLADYKNFLRMRFEEDKATIYAIGLDQVPGRKGWRRPRKGEVLPDNKPQILPKRPLRPHVIEKFVIARGEAGYSGGGLRRPFPRLPPPLLGADVFRDQRVDLVELGEHGVVHVAGQPAAQLLDGLVAGLEVGMGEVAEDLVVLRDLEQGVGNGAAEGCDPLQQLRLGRRCRRLRLRWTSRRPVLGDRARDIDALLMRALGRARKLWPVDRLLRRAGRLSPAKETARHVSLPQTPRRGARRRSPMQNASSRLTASVLIAKFVSVCSLLGTNFAI